MLEAHEILVSRVGEENPQTLRVVANLVELYDAWSKPAESVEWRGRLPAEDPRRFTSAPRLERPESSAAIEDELVALKPG